MNTLKNCAFLTMEDTTGYFVYDGLAVDPLAELGWSVEEIPWNQQGVDWGKFDAVVIRSTWDYQHRIDDFLTALEMIDISGTQLFNPLEICRWNMDKSYLKDLQSKGVSVLPTRWLDRLDWQTCENYFVDSNQAKVVAKPLVGANADHVHVLAADDPETWQAALKHYADKPLMLQPFVDTILTEGEYSLFYFGGEFSHAVQKIPKSGDFRVQEEHGGTIRSVIPDSHLVLAGKQVISQLGEKLLYARTDYVLWQGKPWLIELELVEPSLYFQFDSQAASRFALVLDQMSRKPQMPDRRRL